MRILAIETSCDETAAAVTEGTKILSNVKWIQQEHAQWGGVVPNLAKRAHEERIEGIIELAMEAKDEIGAIAVTAGPGLAIALGVGIEWAKKLAREWQKPLIAVNHIEGHVVSPMADPNFQFSVFNFPCVALVVSGGHTELIYVKEIGKYRIAARKIDDALGEAVDKAARMLGLGYPGGAELEKRASAGNSKTYPLPLPMAGRENRSEFSYSGLKTAFYRLTEKLKLKEGKLTEKQVNDLAAVFQDRAFQHLVRVMEKSLLAQSSLPADRVRDLLVGGGVTANQELRRRIGELGLKMGLNIHFSPKELCGDNAAMIGIAAGFKAEKGEFQNPEEVDRKPRWRVDEPI